MIRFMHHWWTRRCGGREVLTLALPLVISTASWTVMNFIDRMFLLWCSKEAIAAALPAGMLHFTLLCLPLGTALYVNTFVAQYYGAGRLDRIGPVVWQGTRLAAIVTPSFLLTIPLASWVLTHLGHDPSVANLEVAYYQTLAFGAGGIVLDGVLSSFFTGRGETKVVMYANLFQAVLNFVLDYLWIFGHWGFSALGIEGAGWATSVSIWAKAIVYVGLIRQSKYRSTYGLLQSRYDPVLFRRLLKYGGPSGLQMLLECAALSIFLLLVGRLGTDAMAAMTLAFNVNSVAFMPTLGLGLAISTLVGRYQGANQPESSKQITWTGLSIAIVYTGTFAVLYVLVPDWFLFGHSLGSNPSEFSVLRNTTVISLRFVAAYCLFDSIIIVFVGALKGAGDTRFILKASLVLSLVLIATSWVVVVPFNCGLCSCWTLFSIWILVTGIIYLARFLQGKWMQMRVIEPGIEERSSVTVTDTLYHSGN